ncbi:hypothetical protein PL85_16320 [Vibrio anguillarum]|nr:hypothetical protein [Vibrio anguillarum]MBF4227833.1 hypothetical protein [Vibrio anguillarum]MBF4264503.1 hypothetical protein [Vibrio anguillarum]MBT2960508.1 hypothetical protein [Vibrio anguillarum]MBY7672611.1 hypothetical protein [Vibrio anguillarum]STY92366.1 Uncharacterised protein [Vibrio anguillarum]
MNNIPQIQVVNQPMVFLVDSPSSVDLYEGYSIGMALRDALRAIRIPCFYTLATSTETFTNTFSQRLPTAIAEVQKTPNINAIPFVHLCMHGRPEGIALTDNSFIEWFSLRQMLLSHNNVKGFDPFVCMASCDGINAMNMNNAFDNAFHFLIGNSGKVLQSDVTVAYASFYNNVIYKNYTVEQAVQAMRVACGDNNFFYAHGETLKNQKFQQLQLSMAQTKVNSPIF